MGRKYLTALIIVLSLNGPLLALTGAEGVGIPVLDLGLGARPLGMGGAFVALANDGNAGYWNPAGLSQLQNIYITSMYTSLFLGTKFYYAGFSVPIDTRIEKGKSAPSDRSEPAVEVKKSDKYGALSIIWVESFVSGLHNTKDAVDPTTGKPYTRLNDFVARDDAIFLSYGVRLQPWIALGGSAKYIIRQIGINNAEGYGYGFDGSLMLFLLKNLRVGLLFQDVANPTTYWTYTDDLGQPQSSKERTQGRLKGGASFDFADLFLTPTPTPSATNRSVETNGTELEKRGFSRKDLVDSLILSCEVRWIMERNYTPTFHFGLEWTIFNTIMLRIGADDINLTAGVGLWTKVVGMDYAYVTHPDLDNTHRISLTARF